MPKYKTKKGTIKTIKPISKTAQNLLGMKNVKKKASGGNMKKKPVVKAKFGEFMGNISPVAGMITGKGMMGRALGKMGRNVSPLGRLVSDQMRKRKKGSASPATESPQGMTATPMAAATPLMGGGMVKRKRSIDGIAQRGKTRAK